MKYKELRPIRETREDFEKLEAKIIELLRKEIYLPLIEELGTHGHTFQNALDDLVKAIQSGRLIYDRGRFIGGLNSTLSRELRGIGAEWDREHGSFSIPYSKLAPEIKQAILASQENFKQTSAKIADKLREISPEQIAEKLKVDKLFDDTLWKVNKEFHESVKGVTIAPKLSDYQRRRIADEYSKNIKLYIRDFTRKQTEELRQKVMKHATAGGRYENLVKHIQDSYGVAQNKAKFLARQETSILMTKFKETRYQETGIHWYKWQCVTGSAAHPVRPWHKKHDQKTFTWDKPPQTDAQGNHKNPGMDYNCRCVAIPIVKF